MVHNEHVEVWEDAREDLMLGQYHNLQEQEGWAQDRVEGAHKMEEKQILLNDSPHNSDSTTYEHSITTTTWLWLSHVPNSWLPGYIIRNT